MNFKDLYWEFLGGPNLISTGVQGQGYANTQVSLLNAGALLNTNRAFLQSRGYYGPVEISYCDGDGCHIDTSFSEWFARSGLTIGASWPQDTMVYWSFFENGVPVGRPLRMIENTTFIEMLSPAFMAVAGPTSALWSVSSQVAGGVTDSQTVGNVVKLGKYAFGGVDAESSLNLADSAGESPMFDEFNFDSFDYSDGESWTAFSDAENVDYGFDTGADDYAWMNAEADYSAISDGYSDYEVDYGATAESTVSDYGNIPTDTGFGADDFAKYLKGVQVAQQVQKAVNPNDTRQTNAGGGTKYAQTAASISKVIAQATAKSEGSAPSILDSIGGVLRQVETALPKKYTGQLGPNKTGYANPVGQQNMTLVYIGAGLIGLALVMKMKG